MVVAPVVVTPLMASKNASVKSRLRPAKLNGRAPKRAITTQAMVVMTKAWRRLKPLQPDRVVRIKETPTNSVTDADAMKTCQSGCPEAMSTKAGKTMATAKIHSRMPLIKSTGLKSIMSPCQIFLGLGPGPDERGPRIAAAIEGKGRRHGGARLPACFARPPDRPPPSARWTPGRGRQSLQSDRFKRNCQVIPFHPRLRL